MEENIQTPTVAPGAENPAPAVSGSRDHISQLNNENAQRRHENRRLQEENTALMQRLEALETMQTQLATLQQAVEAERAARTAAELSAARTAAALRHGLPEVLATRLQGTSAEELEADAQALAALIRPQGTPASTPRIPIPATSAGNAVTLRDTGEPDIARQIRANMGGQNSMGNSPFFSAAMHREKGGGVVGKETP